ncbi:CPBP family intramembrane glutamic endopeptidase [[Ruminococcus] torques]|uniref:CPBP family intramembrane glutamic endopeptidase n=1 Tax=[Ruminococcus] torques TaxID=33039 RepID=UPI0025A467A6|nr:CPBP family intramembrane glutamic endopeptidase [[Ruminococcus] torques]MDM8236651.1 CPBP family intramembrane metalloprotease [[Ruminococcus] torques]
MKKTNNYWMAVLVFVATMALLYGGAIILSLGAAVGGAVIGGGRAIELIDRFMTENMNLFSCLIYVVPGAVFITWYYFAFVEKRGIRETLYSHTRRLSPACFGWIVLLGFAVQHVISLLMAAIYAIMPSAMDQYTEMIDSSGISQYSILWAVSTLILPPIVEEIIFRGLILQYLGRAGARFLVANLIQAVLFGVFHMNFVQGIYTALLGFLLGWLAYRYDSILVPMVLHAIFNLFGTVLVDLESRFLPDIVLTLIILGSVPLLVITILMIHFGAGEKKKKIGEVQQ